MTPFLAAALLTAAPAQGETQLPVPAVAPHMEAMAGAGWPPGETLRYRVRWRGIDVARTVLEVLPPETVDGEPSWRLRMTTDTFGWADGIYPIHDRIDSWVAADFGRSLFYRKVKAGKTKRDIAVPFAWAERRAQRLDWGAPGEPAVDLPASAYDPLALTFAVRWRGLTKETDFRLTGTDGRAVVPLDIRVTRRETLSTPAGKIPCLLVETQTDPLEGLYQKAPGAIVQLWFEEAPPHRPVRLRSRLFMGSFEATLTGK